MSLKICVLGSGSGGNCTAICPTFLNKSPFHFVYIYMDTIISGINYIFSKLINLKSPSSRRKTFGIHTKVTCSI